MLLFILNNIPDRSMSCTKSPKSNHTMCYDLSLRYQRYRMQTEQQRSIWVMIRICVRCGRNQKILPYNILCWNWLIFNEISSFYSMILTSWCKILWKRFIDHALQKLSEMPTMRLLIALILTNWMRDIGNLKKLENHNYLC